MLNTIPRLSTSKLSRALPKQQFWGTSAHTWPGAVSTTYTECMTATIRIYGKDS
jgi:hypothetical protein